MEGFIKSLTPFFKNLKKIKKHKIEIFFLFAALIIATVSLIIYFKSSQAEEEIIVEEQSEKILPQKIFVDVSGAVEKPDVYQATFGARLKDFLVMAGGLSADADRNFFARNFNLARILTDQEKIYIPSIYETSSGIFVENSRSLDYNSVNRQVSNNITKQPTQEKININTATLEELDQLPGIGKVTATKIIQNRPYQTIEDLLTKKIVKKSVWEKIKDLITL